MFVDDEGPVAHVLIEIHRYYDFEVIVETNSKRALINDAKNPQRFDYYR